VGSDEEEVLHDTQEELTHAKMFFDGRRRSVLKQGKYAKERLLGL
jgi:hypothetical protein